MNKGLVHIYTGCGKGKTSCALGLALRARGAGLKVAFFQFLKSAKCKSSEQLIADCLGKDFKLICFDQEHPMFSSKRETQNASRGTQNLQASLNKSIDCVQQEIASGNWDVVILDEIINAVSEKFIDEKIIINLISAKPANLELVLTGRGATKRLTDLADYVTELKEIKHPFRHGIKARRGIEY